MNWTELLARAGIPESPGYQELLETIREERALALLTEPQGKRKKRRGKKR